ncbi:MAG: hypothetical protein QM638_10875 [Nocardioides sp.]|uniref:hypothetical protein n=1 Tax=Nocardioides sp. TaxID=35761 RepID=UPI0039E366C8
MGWTETRARWRVLRELETELRYGEDLVWRAEYEELFGDIGGLLAAMRYRMRLAYQTQLDSSLPDRVLTRTRRELDDRFVGVRRVLADHAADRVRRDGCERSASPIGR